MEAERSGGREKRKGVGEKGLARAHDISLVALARTARQDLSRHRMWRDRAEHVSAHVAQVQVAVPAWRLYRATRIGTTEANCRARTDGATKRTTCCK